MEMVRERRPFWRVGTDSVRNREEIDEGRQLEGVEHWRADTRRVGFLVVVVHASHAHGFLGQGPLGGRRASWLRRLAAGRYGEMKATDDSEGRDGAACDEK